MSAYGDNPRNAENKLRNQIARSGGNVLVVDYVYSKIEPWFGTLIYHIDGRSYKCKTDPFANNRK